MERIAFVANPKSGASDRTGKVRTLLESTGIAIEEIALDDFYPRKSIDRAGLREDLKRLERSGASRILAAGGDGTVGPSRSSLRRAEFERRHRSG